MAFFDESDQRLWEFDLWGLEDGCLSFALEDSYLSITKSVCGGSMVDWYDRRAPTGIELRIRTSSTGYLEWGYRCAHFKVSGSRVSAYTDNYSNGEFGLPTITGLDWVDPIEWHNYTILIDEENITFLVDGEVATTTDNNLLEDEPQLYLGVGNEWEAWMQIDSIRIFTKEEVIQELREFCIEFPELLASLREEIQSMYSSRLRLYDEASGSYQAFEDIVDLTNARVNMRQWIRLNYDFEFAQMFDEYSLAAEVIEEAEAMGIHEPLLAGMKGNYERALAQPSNADPYLQSIFGTAQTYFGIEVTEPALLPILSILGFILLPALLRRRRT